MAKRKILVIDDDPSWRGLLKRLFGGMEYDVQSAASCADGVKMVEQHKPDCILLDFHLGDGDAVSVCSALRKDGKELKIPVIVVSSDPGAEITAYAECRASYFVLKGSHSMEVLSTIVKKMLLDDGVVPCEKDARIEPSI